MKYSDSGRKSIKSPPHDIRCDVCHRHIDELEPFENSEDQLPWEGPDSKLIKTYREDFPGYAVGRWECRECSRNPYSYWESGEIEKLGRDLTPQEWRHRRVEVEDALEEMCKDDETE